MQTGKIQVYLGSLGHAKHTTLSPPHLHFDLREKTEFHRSANVFIVSPQPDRAAKYRIAISLNTKWLQLFFLSEINYAAGLNDMAYGHI